MKFLYTILLISTVLCSELVNVINIVEMDSHLIDSSYEGEIEKEVSENVEDVIKVKFENNPFLDDNNVKQKSESAVDRLLSTPYLEIHSPPPDLF